MKNKKCTRSGSARSHLTPLTREGRKEGRKEYWTRERLPCVSRVEARSDGCPARGAPDFPSPPLTWGAKRGYRKEVIL